MPTPFEPIAARMRAAGQPEAAISTFARHHALAAAGQTGLIAEAEIEPVEAVPDAETWTGYAERGGAALRRAVIIKLNGGLGTSMGMAGAKALLPVKDGRSFLDIIVRQARHLRQRHGCALPLLWMNSFRTRADTLAALAALEEAPVEGLPLDFVQHRVPKLDARDLSAVDWPADPSLQWCPPGHGDIYAALATSGTLSALLSRGYRHAFVSNADNLGAVLDEGLLGFMVERRLPFMMEVADRTAADRKGGHLARRPGGGLLLREAAQCPEGDVAAFQDFRRHRYFNTNNLWIDLRALDAALERGGGVLGLPLIVNRKTVDPSDPHSPAVLQLETAMGAALSVFEGAGAVRVPRSRFAPVKTSGDLLALRSDAYVTCPDQRVELAPRRRGRPVVVDLDAAYFKHIGDLELRFARGVPSLIDCDRLAVRGDVRFGRGVRVLGDVTVAQAGAEPLWIADGAVLRGRL